ncbi:hypothetical protein [Methanoregula sp.]|uniref:hypothetical protein n=1 Tax=Methanoregula sp. TaxID=2052170 RepID=UPI00356587A3
MPLCRLLLAGALLIGILAGPVSALPDQDYFECDLGDTIALHGVAYTSSQVYLFMTGPGLPANGVTLTDTTLRADQGQFTIVGVADDQTWSMKWNTDRIRNQINPGTYKVYVSPTPVDYSGLGSYKELTVYLKDPGPRNGASSSPGTYTMNPEMHISTALPTTVVTTTATPSPVITTAPSPEPTTPTPTPTQKSGPAPFLIIIALAAGSLAVMAGRRKNP